MERIKLTVSGLKQDLANGFTRPQLSEKYNLPITQINKAMKQAGLKGARAQSVRFELVDDTIQEQSNQHLTVEQVVNAGYSEQQAVEIVSNFNVE